MSGRSAAALALENLAVPPGNRLELLKGDRAGQHSIRINDRYRIAFDGATETPTTWRSLIITEERTMGRNKVFAVHPGEILKTEFMQPMKLSVYRLAKDLDCPGMYEIVRGARAITADTALRLGKYFGLPAQFWMNLQTDYDLRMAQKTTNLGKVKRRTQAA